MTIVQRQQLQPRLLPFALFNDQALLGDPCSVTPVQRQPGGHCICRFFPLSGSGSVLAQGPGDSEGGSDP